MGHVVIHQSHRIPKQKRLPGSVDHHGPRREPSDEANNMLPLHIFHMHAREDIFPGPHKIVPTAIALPTLAKFLDTAALQG